MSKELQTENLSCIKHTAILDFNDKGIIKENTLKQIRKFQKNIGNVINIAHVHNKTHIYT